MAENWSHLIFESIARNDLNALHSALGAHPDAIEVLDRYLNTPLLYACGLGRSHIVRYLLDVGAHCGQLNIFGQNALTLATYSGNFDTCQAVLARTDFKGCNATGLLTPLCVATLQGNIDMAQVYLRLEPTARSLDECPSKTLHGVCPLQLAQIKGDTNMIKLLRPKHQTHLPRAATTKQAQR